MVEIPKKSINFETHPGEEIGLLQLVQYHSFKLKEEYHFRILNYANIRCHKYGEGGYVKFAAIALKSYSSPEIEKNDPVVLEFPYISFCNALAELPKRMKLQTLPSKIGIDNVEIIFLKPSNRRLKIKDMQRNKGCQEDVDKANEVLDLTLWVDEEK